MMDSDNRSALDNYGVWVKKAPKNINEDTSTNSLNTDEDFDISADLPDFSSLDSVSDESTSTVGFDSGATSLTSEELMNITGNITKEPIEHNETPENDLMMDDFDIKETTEPVENDSLTTPESSVTTFDDIPVAEEEILSSEVAPEEVAEPSTENKDDNDLSDILSQNTQIEDNSPLDFDISFDDDDKVAENSTEESSIPDSFDEETAAFTDSDTKNPMIEEDNFEEALFSEPETKAEPENIPTPVAAVEEKVAEPVQNMTPSSNEISDRSASILEKIERELTSLRSEISSLKTAFTELKNKETSTPQVPQEENGFFGNVDEDEIISLSGDEMNNILNNSDFTEEIHTTENDLDEKVETELPEPTETIENNEPTDSFEPIKTIDDSMESFEEPEEAVETMEATEPMESVDTPMDSFEEPEEAVETTETVEPMESVDTPMDSFEEPAESIETMETTEQEPATEELTEEQKLPETINDEDFYKDVDIDPANNLSVDFNNEDLKEPNPEELTIEDNTTSTEEEIPEEISVPKVEDVLVESSSSDLMESAQEETPAAEENPEEIVEDELTEVAEEPLEEVTEEPLEEVTEEEPINSLSNENNIESQIFDDIPEEVNDAISETPSEETEPLMEDANFDLPEEMTDSTETIEDVEAEDTPIIEEPESIENIQDSETDIQTVNTIDELYPKEPSIEESLTNDNLDYLASDAERQDLVPNEEIQPIENAPKTTEMPSDLTKDIKSVLSYMDQLLENLPDEKISEFAQSEQFITYKKLFTELGLA